MEYGEKERTVEFAQENYKQWDWTKVSSSKILTLMNEIEKAIEFVNKKN